MAITLEPGGLIVLSVGIFLAGVGLFLVLPARSPGLRRALGLALVLLGASNVALVLGAWDDAATRSDPYYMLALDATFVAWTTIAVVLLRYPVRSAPRSVEGVLGIAGVVLWASMAMLWTVGRPLLFDAAPDGFAFGSPNVWYHVVHDEGRLYGTILVGASLLLRLPRAPAGERRAANVLAAGLFATSLYYLGIAAAFLVYRVATGTLSDYAVYLGVPGVPTGAYLVYHVAAAYVAGPAFVALWTLRERTWWPLGVAGFGAAVALPAYWTGFDLFFLPSLLTAALPAYAVSRLRAFGSPPTSPRAQLGLALATGLAFFAGGVAVAFGAGATSPLLVTIVTGVALVVAVGAAAPLLPGVRLLLHDAEPPTPTRPVPGSAQATRAPGSGGLILDRYRVLRELGEGGAGAARLCRDERVGRDVVVKSLRPTGAGDRVEAVLREARAIGGIRHPNVVTLFDVAQADGEAVLVMEHAAGGSLRDRLAQGALTRVELARVGSGLLAALDAVHGAGIVHRDVKPSNVLLGADGEPKLADFGIARLPGLETTVGDLRGLAVGTYRYMSPEQARGRPATPRSDLFSAAATLYEAHTGAPYLAASPGETAAEVQLRAASLGEFRADLPDARLAAFFVKALHPEPSQRYQSARDMRAAFETALA